jgi:hypothetical protein
MHTQGWLVALLRGFPLMLAAMTLVLSGGCTRAPRTLTIRLADEVAHSDSAVDLSAYLDKYPDAKGIDLLRDDVCEHSGTTGGIRDFTGDWTVARYFHIRHLILRPDTGKSQTFYFTNRPDSLMTVMRNPTGKVVKIDKKHLVKYKDQDQHTRYRIDLPWAEAGTIIDMFYFDLYDAWSPWPELGHIFEINGPIACEEARFTFIYPDWWGVAVKRTETGQTLLGERQDPKHHKTVLTYEEQDVPSYRNEPFGPPPELLSRLIELHIVDWQMGTERELQLGTWDALMSMVGTPLLSKAREPDKERQRVVDSVCAGATTKRDSLVRIARFVSSFARNEETKYLGDLPKVLRTRQGSALDLTNLTMALLQSVGIHSQILLAHSVHQGWFDPAYISLSQLRAPLVRVKVDSEEVVLFPWIRGLPVGLVPFAYEGQVAMVVSDSAATSLWTIPENDPLVNDITELGEVQFDSLGTATVREERTLKEQDAWEWKLVSDTSTEIPSLARVESLTGLDSAATLDSFLVQADSIRDWVHLTLFYRISSERDTTEEGSVLFRTELPFHFSRDLLIDTTNRVNPVWLRKTQTIRRTMVFHVPDGWQLLRQPDGQVVENDLGSVRFAVESLPGEVRTEEVTHLRRTKAPREAARNLAALVSSDRPDRAGGLVFRTSVSFPKH